VPQGGDPPSYLLAARYNPLVDNFDNPSHGWGYPAAIKLVACSGIDEYRAGLGISAVSSGILVFVAAALGFRYLPTTQAIAQAVVLATHPVVIWMGATAMSDSLFAAIVSMVVWLLFMRDSGSGPVMIAGMLAMFSAFVRGNGLILVLCASAGLLVTPNGRRRLGTFLFGVATCYVVAASFFALQGIPKRMLMRSGAGELAFATLDKADTWVNRGFYDTEYPSYVPLFTRHWRELIRTALKTLYHLYDWWLMPNFPLLCWFIVPGLLLWVRRVSGSALAVSMVFLGVQATFLWSGRFQEGRHLLATLPFLVLMSMVGILLLPRHLSLRRIPVRGPMTVLVTLGCLGFAVNEIGSRSNSPPRDRAMYEAGRFLRSHSKSSDCLVASRTNIAYYAHVRPVYISDESSRGELSRRLRSAGVRWIAWIRGHSQLEIPKLQWLERDESAPELRLVYRNEFVSLWEVVPEAGSSTESSMTDRDRPSVQSSTSSVSAAR
jgi:hypothetical protein